MSTLPVTDKRDNPPALSINPEAAPRDSLVALEGSTPKSQDLGSGEFPGDNSSQFEVIVHPQNQHKLNTSQSDDDLGARRGQMSFEGSSRVHGGSMSPARQSLNDSFVEMKVKGIRRISSVDGNSSIEIRRASVNRFGFLFDDEEVGLFSEEFLTSEEKISANELTRLKKQYNERLEKWESMTKKWSRTSESLIKKRTRKGIPDPYRGRAWSLILKSRIPRDAEFKDFRAVPFLDLLQKLNPEAEYTISVDVPRSFPKHVRFGEKDGEGQVALGHALKAYANLDPEVGYCQGMSFIMATLLMYFTEEEALWAFWCMMGPPYNLREMFLPGLPKLMQSIYVLEKLMAIFIPDLFTHLDSSGMIASIYASPWFMTIFTVGFPFETTLRVLDCFFNEGEKILYRTALGFLSALKDTLLHCDNMDKMMVCIKSGQRKINVDTIFDIGFKLKLTRRQISQFEAEYQASQRDKPQRPKRKPKKKTKSDIPEEAKEIR